MGWPVLSFFDFGGSCRSNASGPTAAGEVDCELNRHWWPKRCVIGLRRYGRTAAVDIILLNSVATQVNAFDNYVMKERALLNLRRSVEHTALLSSQDWLHK